MDIYTTVEEKYLQAYEELHWGELPKALQYFNEVIAFDPDYARAYYQLGNLHYNYFKNFQSAGYYYKKCIDLDADFPDVYEPYLKLIISLEMHKLIKNVADKALTIAGVNKMRIYESLGLYAEKQQNFNDAFRYFKKVELLNDNQEDHNTIKEHQKRIQNKIDCEKTMIYNLQG